jgi:hypothetical protein
MRSVARILAQLSCLLPQVFSFSIPGLVPKHYNAGDNLPIYAGNLMSAQTGMPFPFYELNWCENTVGSGYYRKPAAKSISGENLVHSPYDVSGWIITCSLL